MEPQMETQSQAENALERFVRKTRALFARESDLDKRWNELRPILGELLADPEVIEASKSWPDWSQPTAARKTCSSTSIPITALPSMV